jgi:hypothetical protein
MKTIIMTGLALVLAAPMTFGQGAQGAMIEQRARELSKQNNVRQGIQQPHQPATPAPPPPSQAQPQHATLTPAQIQQIRINNIKTDIAAILADSHVSQEKNRKLATDLSFAARGPKKPSSGAINKLAGEIGTNLAGATLGASEQLRLAQDLEMLVNSAGLLQPQADACVSDVQAILQVAGVKRAAAVGAANSAKAVILEIHQ